MVEQGLAGRGSSVIGRLCQVCVERTGADGGGVAMLSSQRSPVILHATDEMARAVGELQFTVGQGPSVDAVESGAPVLVPDTAERTEHTARWPVLLSELQALDVRALFAFPIQVGQVPIGTLDLYRRRPGELSAQQMDLGVTVGVAIGDSLLAAGPQADRERQLQYPMSVHRAAGMVMVQMDVSIDEALVRLRAAAFEEGVPVTTVATQVLDGLRRFGREDA